MGNNDEIILPDIEFLSQTFDYFNRLIFKNPLPVPIFRIRNVKSFAGQFRCTTKYNRITKRYETSDYIITLSNHRKRARREFEDIIIHEMIHFLIAFNGEKDTSPHGYMFMTLMNNINKRFNRNVTVSIRHNKSEINAKEEDDLKSVRTVNHRVEKSYICLAKMTDGHELLARFSTTVIHQIERGLKEWDKVISWEWFYSKDSCFNDLPRCRTLKLYTPTDKQLAVLKSGKCLSFHVTPSGRFVQN